MKFIRLSWTWQNASKQRMEAGMNEHLSKPLSEAKLLEAIGRYFG